MRLRNFIATLGALAAIFGTTALADHANLSGIFMQFPPAERRAAQVELAKGGFYEGSFDAAWGRDTSVGLFGAADYLATSSYGEVNPDMSSAEGITDFISDLAAGRYSDWLEGRGEKRSGGF